MARQGEEETVPDCSSTGVSSRTRLDNKSRVNREIYARFCEGLRVRFPGPTHLAKSSPQSARDGDFDYYVPGSRERFEVLQFSFGSKRTLNPIGAADRMGESARNSPRSRIFVTQFGSHRIRLIEEEGARARASISLPA